LLITTPTLRKFYLGVANDCVEGQQERKLGESHFEIEFRMN